MLVVTWSARGQPDVHFVLSRESPFQYVLPLLLDLVLDSSLVVAQYWSIGQVHIPLTPVT